MLIIKRSEPKHWNLTCKLSVEDRRSLKLLMDHFGWDESRAVAQAIHMFATLMRMEYVTGESVPEKGKRIPRKIHIRVGKYREAK